MNNLYEVSNKLECLSIETERICDLIQLAAEETDPVAYELDFNDKKDILRAYLYANRATLMASLLDTALMALKERVEELNSISTELYEQSKAQKQAQQQTI